MDLEQINKRLKAEHVRCRIHQTGHKLYLQATLPPKPGTAKNYPHQQWISLGYQADYQGLKMAEAQARLVSTQLSFNQFSWSAWLPSTDVDKTEQKVAQLPVTELISQFEKKYFRLRERNVLTERTWKEEYLTIFKKLPPNSQLTTEMLEQVVSATTPNTRTRRRYALAAAAIATYAGVDFDKSAFIGCHSPLTAAPRELPNDSLVCEIRKSITNHQWQWAFGVLATYGLRPHELFHLDFDAFPVLHVRKGKTGFRHVRPIYPEWASDWNLQEANPPNCSGTNRNLGSRVSHAFRRYNIPFCAYDLRHRWAVRSLEFGYDLSLAAAEMGHSVAVHSQLYHHWISQDVHNKAFERLLANPNRIKAPLGLN